MPNLKRMCREGSFRIGKAVVPTVTNVNNASLITGCFPSEHGVTTNFYYDPKTGQSQEMESSSFLLRPTILERAKARGWKTALVASKDKVRTLCGRGADVAVSAEAPSPEFIAAVGPKVTFYSADSNYWMLKAARYALRTADMAYLSTTDYMMHTYPPRDERSLEHLHNLDRMLGDLVQDHPKMELYLTADHGMTGMHEAVDLQKVLARHSISAVVIPVVRDKHVVHHKNLGGSCYVYLSEPGERGKAADVLRAVKGVEAVHTRENAAARFRLYAARIGDLFVLGEKGIAFGPLDREREDTVVRTHGSLHEQAVPVLAWGARAKRSAYDYNLDLTRGEVY